MIKRGQSLPIQDDFVGSSSRAPTLNPFAQSANITVSVPEAVDIRLVDASALADYEVWTLITSILCSAVVGFVVAYLQATAPTEQHLFFAVSMVFVVLMTVCASMAFAKRRRLTKKARKVRFRIGDQVTDDEP